MLLEVLLKKYLNDSNATESTDANDTNMFLASDGYV